MSSDPAMPDRTEVTGKSVLHKSKLTSLTFRKSTVWSGWSLLHITGGMSLGLHFISQMPCSPLLLKWFLQSECPAPLDLLPFSRSTSAYLLQKASQITLMGMSLSSYPFWVSPC